MILREIILNIAYSIITNYCLIFSPLLVHIEIVADFKEELVNDVKYW